MKKGEVQAAEKQVVLLRAPKSPALGWSLNLGSQLTNRDSR